MFRLQTPRLVLLPLGVDDLADLHAHWTHPDVRRYLWDGESISPDQVRDVIRSSDQLFEEHGVGLWAVCPLDSAPLIGCAGFWYFHEPPELELLLSLSRARWGQGLAQECAEALLQCAFTRLHWPVVQGSADAPNQRSLRLMHRLGMQWSGQRPGEFGAIEVFQITREEWQARQLVADPSDPA